VASLHLLIGLEAYRELRHGSGLSRRQTTEALTELARALLR
jgi:hypothetical protein